MMPPEPHQVLLKHKIVSEEVAASVKAFIKANQTKDPSAAIKEASAPPPKPKRYVGLSTNSLVDPCPLLSLHSIPGDLPDPPFLNTFLHKGEEGPLQTDPRCCHPTASYPP